MSGDNSFVFRYDMWDKYPRWIHDEPYINRNWMNEIGKVKVMPNFEREIEITDSDWVSAVWYDINTNTLDIKTLQGKRYRYTDVISLTFARIITAKSVGRAINNELRERNHTVVS